MSESNLITIVLPCYRPGANWQDTIVKSIGELKQKVSYDIELIVVDDGNVDKTPFSDLKALENAVDKFKYVTYPENHGKGYALRKGVEQATGKYVIYTDVDIPYTVDSMYHLIQKLDEGNALVVGVKDEDYYKHTPAVRKYISKILRFFIRFFLSIPITDTQCGLKGFKQEVRPIFLSTTIERYLFDLEFIKEVYASEHKKSILALPISLKPGITFSKMNNKVLMHEMMNFGKLYFKKKPES